MNKYKISILGSYLDIKLISGTEHKGEIKELTRLVSNYKGCRIQDHFLKALRADLETSLGIEVEVVNENLRPY